jgi:hypothetical protein
LLIKMDIMRKLKKISALFIVLTIAFGIKAQYSNYKFPEADLSINFPADPGTAQVIKDTKTKQVRKYVVKLKDGDNEYRAEVEFYKEKNPKREIDNFFLAMLSKAQETSNVNFGGKAMTMAKGGTKRKKAVLCVYYNGNKVYRLSIKSPGSYVADEEAEKFFGSLNKSTGTVVASNTNNNKSTSTSTTNTTTKVVKKDDNKEYIQSTKRKISLVKNINRNIVNLGQYPYYFEDFAKDIKELDYANAIKEVKEKGNPGNEFWKQDYEAFLAFETTFPNDFETKAMPRVNEQITYVHSLYSKRQQYPNNINKAINELEKIKPAIDASKKAFPNSEAIKNGAIDFYTAWDEIAGPVYKGTYLCDFHKENPGRIFYSKEPIDPNNIDPSKFTTEFSLNDHIYAIVFLPKKMKLMGEPGKDDKGLFFKYFTNIDHNVSYTDYVQCYIDKKEYEKNKAYFLMDVMPDPAKASQWDAGMWMDKFAKLSPRKHKFNVSVYKYQPTNGWAAGEFSIDLTGMDKAKMAADAKAAMTKVEENIAKNQQLPAAFKKKSAVFKDPALSVNNIKAIVKREWGSYIAQVLKVAIVNDGKNNWEVAKDDLGYPENKQNSCAIYIAYKGTDGKCYFIDQSILFVKDYEGGGRYSSTIRIWGHYDLHKIVRIACENIK